MTSMETSVKSDRPVRGVTDPGIPALATVLDPRELLEHLRPLFEAQWGEPEDIQVDVLKHHPRDRCTVQIAWRAATAQSRALIGKVYAEDRSDVYDAMQAIAEAGFGPREELSIPQPLGYVSALNLLLQEQICGPEAEEFVLSGQEHDRTAAIERCALWLARFHSTAPGSGPILDLSSHLTSLKRWSRRIAKRAPMLAGKVTCLFERLEAAASRLGQIDMCAGHGSYGPTQVILAAGRSAAIDWDGHDVADPSRDVARYLVSLRYLALEAACEDDAMKTAARLFLDTYAAARRSRMELHLPFHMAATCLQLAKYELSRPVEGYCETMEVLIDEGLRILEDGNCAREGLRVLEQSE